MDDPFQITAPINFNGRQYAHLPADLAQRVAALPPMPAAPQRRHRRNEPPPLPMPVSFF